MVKNGGREKERLVLVELLVLLGSEMVFLTHWNGELSVFCGSCVGVRSRG